MKKILLLLFMLNIFYGNLLTELESLDGKQKEVLLKSLQYGKEHDLSLTLAAIAWQETNFGKNTKNPTDGIHGSYCTYQILVQTASKRANLNPKLVKKKLLTNFDFCKDNAIAELLYWKERWRGNYSKMVASYNAGNSSLNNPQGEKYYKAVAYKVRALEKYIKKYKLEY